MVWLSFFSPRLWRRRRLLAAVTALALYVCFAAVASINRMQLPSKGAVDGGGEGGSLRSGLRVDTGRHLRGSPQVGKREEKRSNRSRKLRDEYELLYNYFC